MWEIRCSTLKTLWYLEKELIEFAQPTFDYEFSAMSFYLSLSG